jgi:hypothetical protein
MGVHSTLKKRLVLLWHFRKAAGFEFHDMVDDLRDAFLDGDFFSVFQGKDRLRRAFHKKDQVGIHVNFLPIQPGNFDHSASPLEFNWFTPLMSRQS